MKIHERKIQVYFRCQNYAVSCGTSSQKLGNVCKQMFTYPIGYIPKFKKCPKINTYKIGSSLQST